MGTKHKKTRVAHATIAHRYTMDRMLDKKLQPQLRKSFEAELAKMRASFAVAFKGKSRIEAGPKHAKQAVALLSQRMPDLSKVLQGHFVGQTRETQAEAVRSLAAFMGSLKHEGTLLDDHAASERIMRSERKVLKEERRQAGERLSIEIAQAAKKALESAPKGLKVGALADHVQQAIEGQWWQVERTMRTETSRTFNQTQDRAFDDLAEEFPGLYKRWTELVNDLTGAPMDDRVAQDSLILHGQIAKPGSVFYMPSVAHTPSYMLGKSWSSPPNRPNDRAVLTPWHDGCGVPAWIYRAGERHNVR